MQCHNMHIMGIPKKEESKQGTENLSEEIISKNVPNLVNKIKRHTSQGSSESLKQVRPKEAYNKTHHKQNVKA